MFIIVPKIGSGLPVKNYNDYEGAHDAAVVDYASNNQEKLSIEQIKEMIIRAGLMRAV